MNGRSATLLLIVLLAVMTGLPLLHSGYTSTDDLYMSLRLQEGDPIDPIASARDTGRLQHVVASLLTPFAYGGGNYWVMKGLALAAILGNVAALFLVLRLLSESVRVATLAVVFFFAFIQNSYDHNLLTSFPFIFSTALTAFWLSVAAWWLALHGRRRMGGVSLVLFAGTLLVYEVFLTYAIVFPVLTAVARPGPWTQHVRGLIRSPHLAVTAAVLVAVVVFPLLAQSETAREMMITEQYAISLDAGRTLKVIERFGSFAFPLQYLRPYTTVVNDHYLGFGTFTGRLPELFEVIDAAWLVKALIVAALTAALTLGAGDVVRRRGLLLFLAFVFLALTHLPLAVTAKYQEWANELFVGGYVTSYFAFFGVVILLALVFEGVVHAVSRMSRHAARVCAVLLAAVAFVTSYGTDLVNAHVSLTTRRMYDRWQTVDTWIASPVFQAIPDGSLILAPSLFERHQGTPGVFDDYWTRYLSQSGGKPVEVIGDRHDWQARAQSPAAGAPRYFLGVTQPPRGDATYLVFSRIEPAADGASLASREVMLLSHARSDHFRIVGRLVQADPSCRARVFVDDTPTAGTFVDRFGAHIDRPRRADAWLWTRLSSDAAIDPASLLVAESTVAVDGVVDVRWGDGFVYADPLARQWSGATAVLTLHNRDERAVDADLLFDVEAPGLAPDARSRLRARAGSVVADWEIGPQVEPRSMRIEVPAASTVDVMFSTDAPRVPGPATEMRVMRFLPTVRVQERGCDG